MVRKNPFIDIALLWIILLIFTLGFFFFELYLSRAFLLLVGIWFIDFYLKRLLQFDNITLFADLSFSALVFAIGQGISLIDLKSEKITIEIDYVSQLLFTTFMLFVLWLINLGMCDYISKNAPQDESATFSYGVAWFTSFFIALLSVCVIIILQIIERS